MHDDDPGVDERVAEGQEPADTEQLQLIDLPPDWADMWQGMPEYSHDDLMPWQTLLVHFRTPRDRQAFAELVNQSIGPKTKFIWHPRAEIERASTVVFTRSEKVTPRYPVYIISKGRWESRLTSKCFEWIKVPYHIVIEPQEYESYAAVIDPAKILVLPFSNLGQGGIPARNWVWDHAAATGAARHWIFDDNIDGFCRFHNNLKVKVDSGVTLCAVEDFTDRYENVALSGFNYNYFAPRKQGSKIRPFTLNTRIYSGILIKNDAPYRWRGRYNEDTDLSLRALKDGWCTILFNAFLMYKRPTLTMKGGNTDQLYAGVESTVVEWESHVRECQEGCRADESPRSCQTGRDILSRDGRWLMAESLRAQHPDCVTVERKWQRWQHQVDYRLVKNNRLIPRADAPAPSTDYGMELTAMPEDEQAQGAPRGAGQDGQGESSRPPRKPSRSQPGQAAEVFAGPPVLDFLGPTEPSTAELAETAEPPPAPRQGPSVADVVQQPSVSTTSIEAFTASLRSRGHRVLTRDGRLFVSEASRLTEGDRLYVREHRAELLAVAEAVEVTQTAVEPVRVEPVRVEPVRVEPVRVEPVRAAPMSLGQLLGSSYDAHPDWKPDEPPILDGIDSIVLNFATSGLDWARGDRPVGVTVSTLDGQLVRFLPFGFKGGGNLDEETIKRWAREQLRGKNITNANTRFDVHMAREWGVNLEDLGCTVSDVMHYAALLDDHRKQFKLDALVSDFLPDTVAVERLDESQHDQYHAREAAERERYTAEVTARLRTVMWPRLEAEDLQRVRQLEDDVIYPLVEMEKNGSPLDLELLDSYHRECMSTYGRLMVEVTEEAGFAFTHTATGWQRLFEKCGIPPSDSYAEDVIETVSHPLVRKAYLAGQYASLDSKTFSAYAKQVDASGLLRYSINQLRGDDGGTVSGRFSIGYVQQVPNHDNHSLVFGEALYPRRLFKPADGLYLEADAEQIEYRIFAHFAENPQVLKAYRENPRMSFHKTTWEMIKLVKPDQLYSHQKNFNFARMYGARSIKLAVMMKFITAAEGEEIRAAKRWSDPRLTQIKEIEEAYAKVMPEVDKLLDYASHLAKPACDKYCKSGDALHRSYPHRGYVRTLLGRRSRFANNYKTYIGLNRVIQGTAADVMKMKLVELHRQRRETGFTMRLTVHDAVCGDVPDLESKHRVDEILNSQSLALKVPILWAVKSGANWAEAR